MEIKKILYATNIKGPVYNPIEGLLSLKKAGLEEILVLSDDISGDVKKGFSENGVTLRNIEGSGPITSRILDSARSENPSLIVTFLRKGKRRFFRGAVSRNLIKNITLPLLLIHEDDNKSNSDISGLFDNVLLATHWSDSSGRAWLFMIGLKKIIGVVDIVYVLNEKPTIKEIRQIKERVEDIRRICLEEKIDAESHIYAGKTSDEILLAASEYDATLIIMGTSSKGILSDIFSRPVCYRVVEKSPVPVLIIP